MTEITKLTAEWCLDRAAAHDRTAHFYRGPDAELIEIAERLRLSAEVFRIAAKVLDPEAREKVGQIISETIGDDFSNEYARAAHMETAEYVLSYLTGEKADG